MTTENKKNKEDNFLLYIPNKKHQLWEEKNGRVLLIFKHNKTVEKIVRWLVKKPNTSDLELDDIGSKVWLYIDGKSSVYQIGQKLTNDFGEKIEPVYDRLIMYLRYLNKKGWIFFERGNQKEAD